MKIKELLKTLASQDGSDLYLTVNAPPSAKFQGQLTPLAEQSLTQDQLQSMLTEVLNAENLAQFEQALELNIALDLAEIGRFRVNVLQQRNQLAVVARNIKTDIPSFAALKLPEVLKDVIMEKRGLILFVGGTGSGKSTSWPH